MTDEAEATAVSPNAPARPTRTLSDAAVERLEYLARLGASLYARLERQHDASQQSGSADEDTSDDTASDVTTSQEGSRA
jgi:hypothetical protein